MYQFASRIKKILFLFLTGLAAGSVYSQENRLSEKERIDGWQLLFDGNSMDKWKSTSSDEFPSAGWKITDGVLWINNTTGRSIGGDLITKDEFFDFELVFDFKLSEGANSGLKYRVQKYTPPIAGLGTYLGPEYQLLDNDKHPDAKAGKNGNRKLASLYDILPSSTGDALKPVGEWSTARIVVEGDNVEHWLNGIMVLKYNTSSELYNTHLASSKFSSINNFGKQSKGHLLLQDHGDMVYFKNIKIRKL